MGNIIAKDIMKSDIKFAYEGWSIRYLADFFQQHKISGAPVITANHDLVGVVSVTDVFNFENQDLGKKEVALRDYYQVAYGNDVEFLDINQWTLNAEENCTVQQIMVDNLITVKKDATVSEVSRLMLNNNIHRVFVVEGKQVVGVISTSDLLALLIEHD